MHKYLEKAYEENEEGKNKGPFELNDMAVGDVDVNDKN